MTPFALPGPIRHLTPVALAAALAFAGSPALAQTVTGQIVHDGALVSNQSGTAVTDSYDIPNTARASYVVDAATGVLNVAAAHGGDPGRIDSSVTYTHTLQNTTGVAQNVSFSFYVYAGAISARTGYASPSEAGYSADIAWGGSSVWHAGIDLTKGTTFDGGSESQVQNLSPSASDFAFTLSPGWEYSASWSSYSKTLGLGILNPGESRTLTYSMATYSSSGPGNFNPYGGAAGMGGDPLSFETSPLPSGVNTGVTFSPAAPVPEPETYAMMALGLGVLGAAARRRRKG